MRGQARRDDCQKESGDCGGKSKTKRGRRIGALNGWYAVNKEKDSNIDIFNYMNVILLSQTLLWLEFNLY